MPHTNLKTGLFSRKQWKTNLLSTHYDKSIYDILNEYMFEVKFMKER